MKELSKIKKIAVLAAKKAGHELVKRYKNFDRGTVKLKAHHEILTQADLASERIILGEIKKNFPNHRILSEERGYIGAISSQSAGKHELPLLLNYLWIVDPLDGSTNFSMHNPIWSVSIGIVEIPNCGASLRGGEIILGIIYAPMLGELYIAEKGKGATRNGKKIRVSSGTRKSLHTFCHGRSQKEVKRAIKYYSHQKLRELDCRQLGSAAIELAYVASGRTESITIPGVNSWDVAAGVLLVREAGGRVTDFKGKEWRLDSKDMLATNGKAHEEILKVARKI